MHHGDLNMKYKTVSTIAAILCGTLLAFVVRAQENEQVKAAATRPNSESAQPAAEKKKVRGTAADLLLKIKHEDIPYVPKSEYSSDMEFEYVLRI